MRDIRVGGSSTGHGETSRSLPPELVDEGVWRLGWLGLVFAGTAVFGYFARRAIMGLSGSGYAPDVRDLFASTNIVLGIAMYVIASRRLFSPRRTLDLGLGFMVAGAVGIAFVEFWNGLPPNFEYLLVPAECVWIVAFPLIVPNTPGKVLVSSLLAASGGPAALAGSAAAMGRPAESPFVYVGYFLPSTYLCAVVAFIVSKIMQRFGVRLRRAREIGSYELVDLIGEGGMGEVWQARHRLLARPAAIKLIRTDVLGTHGRTREAIIRRFEHEAQDTATLGSTHTIDIYDFGVTEDGDFYYVMELLNGLSLERFVREFGPMEPARAVHVLRQVCHSLGEAHARGLVHRDIKPANIFLCRLGPDDDFVKVLDFGLVKHLDAAEPGTMLTVEGQTAGTPAFMAPEVALGRADIDGRCDLYSLGCVAYYMLTGRPVFAGDTAVATVLAHVKDEPVPVSIRSEFAIPPLLDRLILDCLAKEPAARPATAAELSERLALSLGDAAWTAEQARAWWELHRHTVFAPKTGAPQAGTAGAAAADAVAGAGGEGACRRCWPRLDRTPVGDRR